MSILVYAGGLFGKRKLAWLPRHGPPDPRDLVYQPGARTGVKGSRSALTGEVSVKRWCPPVFDQGYSGSCVWQAIAAVVSTLETAQGLKLDIIARRSGYYLARRKDGITDDGGCYTDTSFSLFRKYGCPSESAFPWTTLKINEAPNAGTILLGDTRRGCTYEYIRGNVTERHLLADAALAEGLPVYATAMVGQAFRAYRGGVLDTVDSRPEGGHAFAVVGSAKDGSAPLKEIRNSWGTDWGQGGYAWVGPKFFAECRELVIVHDWKRSARAIR